ncbi:ubiquitin carboxyl-terminal hydrolase 47-like isoform 2-T2 [Anableps anableps]
MNHCMYKTVQMQRCQKLDLKYRNINCSTVTKFRKKLKNLSISDYQGLMSPGLTCYLNSVLQVLFMTEEFREAVTRDRSESPTTIDHHLGELFHALEGNMAKTHNITKILGIKDVYEQRDAAEYFEKILCRTSPEASKIFKGELNHKTTCLKCNKTNNSTNFFWVLPLSMGDSKSASYSVLQGWKSFFQVQRVCEDNQMFCCSCNQKQDADIEYEMRHCPDVLTLLLKRFSFDYQQNCYVKLQCNTDVAQTLETKNCRYALYAVVHHFGDLMGGHYIADIKSFETGRWYCFDDNTVKCINEVYVNSGKKTIRSATAYLLMYKMVRGRAKKTDGSALEDCFTPSDETEDKRNEAEPREDLVFEDLLKTESCRGEGMRHLNMIRDDEFKKIRSNSFRGGNDQLNQRAAPQGIIWLPADTDTKEQMFYNNSEKASDWTFYQSSISPIKGRGVNDPRDKHGNNKTKTGTNNHLYNHSPTRDRIESAKTTDVINSRKAVVATQRNGPTVTKKTCVSSVYCSTLFPTRSSQSFRTAAEPSASSPSSTSKSFKGKQRSGATDSNSRSEILGSEKTCCPSKTNQTTKR